MQGSEQMIELYHAGFLICLYLALFFAALSVFIFFKFKIRQVFDFMTGRGEKRTIRQMEEENAKTGKLRQDTYASVTSEDLVRTPSGNFPKVIFPITEQMNTGTEVTERTYTPGQDKGGEKTELLREEDGSEETTLLTDQGSFGETTLLGFGEEKQEEEATLRVSGKFEIVKENIWIHTKEII